jgi:hypothetical protein
MPGSEMEKKPQADNSSSPVPDGRVENPSGSLPEGRVEGAEPAASPVKDFTAEQMGAFRELRRRRMEASREEHGKVFTREHVDALLERHRAETSQEPKKD